MARLEDLRNEYRELSFHFRLVSAFRLGTLSFFAGFVGWMANFIWVVYRDADSVLRALIPLSAFIGSLILSYVDRRLLRLYDAILERGVELENILDVRTGVYRRLINLQQGPRLRKVANFAYMSIILIFILTALIDAAMFIVKEKEHWIWIFKSWIDFLKRRGPE